LSRRERLDKLRIWKNYGISFAGIEVDRADAKSWWPDFLFHRCAVAVSPCSKRPAGKEKTAYYQDFVTNPKAQEVFLVDSVRAMFYTWS
jgi:hypothetical protein